MATKPQFYVYVFEDDDGFVYVGKGCRARFKAQQRAFEPGILDPSKVDAIRQVACGCRV